MTAMTIVSGSSFPVNSAFATAHCRVVRNAFAALTGYRAGPRPDLCATHRPYVRIGTACLRAATFSRYSRAFSTVRPRSCLASSIDFFHAIGRSRPYARAIVSILYSTVYPSFVIRSSLQRHELRRARRADPRSAVDHGLASHRELADEMADHLGLDLDRHELLPVVDRDLLPDEVGQDRHVAAVRPDCRVGPVRAELLDERQALVIKAADETPARTRRQELDDLLERHRLHLVERVAAVGELFLASRLHEARAGDRADRRAAIRMERSELARRQLDDGPISLAHDDGLRARGADEAAPVSRHRLEIVNEGPFGDLAQGHRVPAVEIRRAVGHRLPDGKPVARDHEHFVAIEPHPRERGRVARRLEDGGHDAVAAEMRVRDRTRMAVARRPIRRRGPAAAALARKVLAHQNTPIRIPISSAENSGLSLMIACLPSLRTNVLTFSTLTWNRSSNAFLTWSLVARRITRNSRRFPSFRF